MATISAKKKQNKQKYASRAGFACAGFCQLVPRRYSSAGTVICRSGASSLYEIRALGKASILIPSPNVAENHQYYNAMELVNNDAAMIIEEKDLTGKKLLDMVNGLVKDPERLHSMEANARSMAILDATDRIADQLVALAESAKTEES